MATESTIPIVDFQSVLSSSNLSSCDAVKELHKAFTEVGFVFITNHGVKQHLIDRVNSVSLEFFQKPLEIKRKCQYRHEENDTNRNGYICLGQEREKLTTPGDQHEAFDICSIEDCNYPDEDMPEFRHAITELYKEGSKLALVVLELIGHALKPEDPLFLVRIHTKIGKGCQDNYSSTRVNHYPPLPPSFDFGKVQLSDEDQVLLRKHEHVDYGSLTLLFPDPKVGGLQVKRASGGWIDAPCMADVIIVNLGAFMQIWTSDRYLATPHRVIIPKDEATRSSRRQSIAMFIHPDAETLIESIDGLNKYPPIVAGQHTRRRLEETLHTSYEK